MIVLSQVDSVLYVDRRSVGHVESIQCLDALLFPINFSLMASNAGCLEGQRSLEGVLGIRGVIYSIPSVAAN